MNLQTDQTADRAIVYDADCIQQPGTELFDQAKWQQKGCVTRTAAGRGNALMLQTEHGPWVLRAYLRGGWAARFSRDRYLFTGFSRSRPLAEVNILAQMHDLGLPVAKPVAALCLRHGLSYSGVLLTHQISPSETLADHLEKTDSDDPVWLSIGRCIRRFHNSGVVHPDLNARNILLSGDQPETPEVFLIDFDKAFIRPGSSRSFRSNLDRLKRSLTKLWPQQSGSEMETCWQNLMDGYHAD
jgi:3-deoxy-D-manno-octulosonic acid kinase